jgi:hypothetical protein
MALADLMKRGFLTSVISSATATVATTAAYGRRPTSVVASVAGVAVAKTKANKTANNLSLVRNYTDLHDARPNNNENHLLETLSLFCFDSIQREIDAGCSADELHRVNDMAFEFMRIDSMSFADAIKLAAEIVVNLKAAPCEAAYEKTMELFRKIAS